MFTTKYVQVFRVLLLLFAVWSHVKANNQTTIATAGYSPMIPSISSMNGQIQPSSIVPSPSSTTRSETVTSGQPRSTTKRPVMSEEDKLEPYVFIIIAASAAVVLIVMVILLLLCIFRRRRIQRLERERNLSYNNMNYESTVKFRADMDENGTTTLEGDQNTTSPRKTSNKPRPDAGYELVDLPGHKKQTDRPQYENVTPQIKETNDTARPDQQYENVSPVKSSDNDKPKTFAIGQYEEVFLESPEEKNGDKKKRNNKYYENVELNV